MPDEPPRVVTLEPVTVAVLRETVRMEELRGFYDRAFAAVARVVTDQGATPDGPAVGVFFSMPTDTVDVGAGFPVTGEVAARDGVATVVLPGGPALQVEHRGSYDTLATTYSRLAEWVREGGEQMATMVWETYLTQPTPDADPDTMVTLITWPFAD